MKTLKLGSKGDAVIELQERLAAAGFDPGKPDGDFGPATEAAVIKFQKAHCLLADGMVGKLTTKAIIDAIEKIKDKPDASKKRKPSKDIEATKTTEAAETPDQNQQYKEVVNPAMPKVTVKFVSKLFPHTPVGNIQQYLPYVLDSLVKFDLTDKPMVLMALATINAESEGFLPISEYLSRYNTSSGGEPYDLYDFRTDIGNKAKGDGAKYKGRGFIQLTGKYNYVLYGEKLGLGDALVNAPDLANEPEHAADVLAVFLKDKEQKIKAAIQDGDLKTARKLVNGGSHGLERFQKTYEKGEALLA